MAPPHSPISSLLFTLIPTSTPLLSSYSCLFSESLDSPSPKPVTFTLQNENLFYFWLPE